MKTKLPRPAAGETERLRLLPLTLADAPQIQAIFPHWEIVRYLDNHVPWPYPADGAQRFVEDIALPAVQRGESWIWTIRLKQDAERIIGSLELRKGDDLNRGFWMATPWQGQGLMSEACAWSNDFWFETLGFARMRVWKAAANLPSCQLSVKQGMRLVGVEERDFVSGQLPAEIWEITAAEWRAHKGRHS